MSRKSKTLCVLLFILGSLPCFAPTPPPAAADASLYFARSCVYCCLA